jgi:pyrroloquinoline quinone (PQQ) biosynthesis protein C
MTTNAEADRQATYVVDDVAAASLAAAREWDWVTSELTLARAQAYVLQHILRNRFFSAVMRPAWMSRCSDMAIVRKTIGQMMEELVYDPAIKKAHTQILWQLGRHVGLTDEQMDTVEPETETAACFAILENLARDWHWTVGWMGSSIDEFVLVQLPEHNFRPERWKTALGLTDEEVFFIDYHLTADLEHAGKKVWEPMRRHITPAIEAEIRRALPLLLEAARLFYAGIERHSKRLNTG